MKKAVTIILIILTIHFWRYISISESIFKLTDFFLYILFGISFVVVYQKKDLRFKNLIILFIIGLILNAISALLNNGQSLNDTLLSLRFFYFILFYFFLHMIDINRRDLEHLVFLFAVIYSIFYLVQKAAFPRIYFIENIFADRGTIRMRLVGDGFLALAYFMLLNRYLIKRRLFDLIMAVFFFYIIILAGFRTLSASTVLLSGFIFIKRINYSIVNYFLVAIAVVLFIGLLQLRSTSSIIMEMINVSEQQKKEGEKYIRKMQYNYFTKEYPKNFTYYIFGGGYPGAKGSYARKMLRLIGTHGFYWVDLGLIGFFLVLGGITTLALLWISFKAIFIKLPPEGIYLNVYFAFLLLATNITLDQMFRDGIFGVEAIVLYLIDKYRDDFDKWELSA